MEEKTQEEALSGRHAAMGRDLLNPIEMDDGTAVKDTDIVFDCPNCSKSLAIDYRGAGLVTNCTECSHQVEIPIPKGMDLADLDLTSEDQELRILNLRRSLMDAEERISKLVAKVGKLEGRRATLEKTRAEAWHRFEEIASASEVVRKAQLELATAIGKIMDVSQRKFQ